MTCSKLEKWLIIVACSKLGVPNKAIHDVFKSQKEDKLQILI